jgi:hypothetical protein
VKQHASPALETCSATRTRATIDSVVGAALDLVD